ncbi:hypothetical protein OCC47_20710 [Bacillus cereus]|nr:hypothetical protein [Bacillus cereus]
MSDMYESYDVSEALKKMLLNFNKKAGIQFGAFDLIKTNSGKYVFLECNPSGQWLWIEEKVNSIDISKSVVNLLISQNIS